MQEILVRVFKLNVDGQPGEDWRRQINKNRRENDLVMVLHTSCNRIVHVETKGGQSQGNAEKQFRMLKKWMELHHGAFLTNSVYVPILAKHKNTGTAPLCDGFKLDIDTEDVDFDHWWNDFQYLVDPIPPQASQEEFEYLVKRLLMNSSLVLTSLAQQLSQNTPESFLIILRYMV